MGRIKSRFVKTLGDDIIKEYGSLFTEDFEKNKEILESLKTIKSKKIKNILAGYITKEIERIKKSGL